MTRTLYDAIHPANMPSDAQMVAGYSSGYWPTFAGLAALFPDAIRVSIAVDAQHDAQVADIEYMDLTADQAPAWVVRQRSLGGEGSLYCSRSAWPAVIAAIDAAGIAHPPYWIAHYTGIPHLCDGACYPAAVGDHVAVATQYGGDIAGGYDISLVADYWPGVDGLSADSAGATRLDIGATPPEDDVALTPDQETAIALLPGIMALLNQTAGLGVYAIVDPEGAVWQRTPAGWAWIDGAEHQNNILSGRYIVGSPVTVSGSDRDLLHHQLGVVRAVGGGPGPQRYIRDEVLGALSVITDPASGVLVRIAALQAAVAALPPGTTTADPAAQKALADIATLAAGFADLAGKLA